MNIHREGTHSIIIAASVLLLFNFMVYVFLCDCIFISILSVILSLFIFFVVVFFFRKPKRIPVQNILSIISPADGKIVVIEKTKESEYFKDERIQISVFMSLWNVHINWFPISGIVKYFRYHEGKYLLARNPKSSSENERTSVVIENENGKQILYRQIAGIVARRVVFYVRENDKIEQSKEAGFIKFGSRLDVFLPLTADIKVKIGDKVKGSQSIIAEFTD